MALDLPQRLAAAAAVDNPGLLLQLRAAEPPAPRRPPRDLGTPLMAVASTTVVRPRIATCAAR